MPNIGGYLMSVHLFVHIARMHSILLAYFLLRSSDHRYCASTHLQIFQPIGNERNYFFEHKISAVQENLKKNLNHFLGLDIHALKTRARSLL